MTKRVKGLNKMQKIILATLAFALLSRPAYADEVIGECVSGECYYNSRQSACLAAGIGIGVLVFAGMIAIVVNEGNCSHSH